jgi:hypothetical protein
VTGPVSPDDIETEFPDWEVWRGIDNRWHARIRGAEPPIVVHDDHLDGLREEISRKMSRLDERAWAEGRQSSRGVELSRLIQANSRAAGRPHDNRAEGNGRAAAHPPEHALGQPVRLHRFRSERAASGPRRRTSASARNWPESRRPNCFSPPGATTRRIGQGMGALSSRRHARRGQLFIRTSPS